MSELSERAEQIAARLIGHASGAQVEKHDIDGRQGVVDFLLEWENGDAGALEVTMITEPASSAWQGLAMRDGWRWPAATSWDFRPTEVSFPYKRTKRVALRAVALCDEWHVDDPSDLPDNVLALEPAVKQLLAENVGRLKRTPFSPGIMIYQSANAEFVEATPADFTLVVQSWLGRPHIEPHLQKLRRTSAVARRFLFLVVVSEALPVRFFTDDFEAPSTTLRGYEGVDAVFVWSDYWHRYLSYQGGLWEWNDFPPNTSH